MDSLRENKFYKKRSGIKGLRAAAKELMPYALSPSTSALCCMLIALCLLFIPSKKICAQQELPELTQKISVIDFDEEGGKLSYPSFVMPEPVKNEIYVVDSMSRFIIYTSDFFPLFTISKRNGIQNPQGLVIDEEGNIFIGQAATKDEPRHRISVFNACLKWERDIFLTGFEDAMSFIPFRMAIDKKGRIYVAGLHYPGVLIIDRHGRVIDIISPLEGERKAKINNVTIDKNGRIYLLSEDESRVYVYDEDWKFLFKFGEKGGSTGKLSRPRAVAVDNNSGKMYVVDYMRHTVNVYDKTGKYIYEFGGMGWGEGWFQYPTDVKIDSNGRLLVTDTFNDRVQVFNHLP